jgi:DNA-binding XRE family transcriptional regulator
MIIDLEGSLMAKSEFSPAKKRATLTTGEVIRMLRELKGWTQEELGRRSGLNANISLLENGRIEARLPRTRPPRPAFASPGHLHILLCYQPSE